MTGEKKDINNGKTLWKNATKCLLKSKTAKEGYTNLDMGSLSEVSCLKL